VSGITVTTSSDRTNPERYQCPNFDNCGTSCSHAPEYMGWPMTGLVYPRRACSNYCVRQLLLSKSAQA